MKIAYKLLDPTGCTYYRGETTQYPLPSGDGWGPWIHHPDPADPDGQDRGPGRYHLMRRIDSRFARYNWWPWEAHYRGLVGESDEKIAATSVRLRRISPDRFADLVRQGEHGLVLRRAILRGADLRGADLTGAYLTDAKLRGADLRGADLTDANLRYANLRGANLRYADLTDANLTDADLTDADLTDARGV